VVDGKEIGKGKALEVMLEDWISRGKPQIIQIVYPLRWANAHPELGEAFLALQYPPERSHIEVYYIKPPEEYSESLKAGTKK
jgi:hypothetical protein